MDDRISNDEADPVPEFYIPATTSLAELEPRTLKHGDSFAVFDHYGDVLRSDRSPQGLFHRDTRYLSRLEVLIDGKRPLLLSSTVDDENVLMSVDLTNPDRFDGRQIDLSRDSIHLLRSKFLWMGHSYERFAFRNFDTKAHEMTVEIRFAADFADLFEARGQRRAKRGRSHQPVVGAGRVVLAYDGLDNVTRVTTVRFDPKPEFLTGTAARFRIALAPGQRNVVLMAVTCAAQPAHAFSGERYFFRLRQARRAVRAAKRRTASVTTANALLNEALERAQADLAMLMTDTDEGPYPYAGIPWFSTMFGRDAIITAHMMLWADPTVARGVLMALAARQATAEDPLRDAEPGKILHETRGGEMANLREVPFGLYYGGVDSTPLFVMLAGAYFERTLDLPTIRALWPHIEAAVTWIDAYGDRDGDGFVEYGRRTEEGLANQGWKDSHDSIFHADGTLAQAPIALCEVQGYVYAAKRAAARLARAMDMGPRADALDDQAAELAFAFNQAFWCDDIGTYALALDGQKRPCRVRSSNAGHTLFSGIADPHKAAQVVATLMSGDSFSGWGIRTIPQGESRYNPMSYHNGSIWPHDNGLIALGLARYGFKEPVLRLFGGLFDASLYMELRRLPELFCGFSRRPGKGPTLYPVACAPQAWASATLFALLQASLGIAFDPAGGEIRFDNPRLPLFLDAVQLSGVSLGPACADVSFCRHGAQVAVSVIKRTGNLRIITVI
ncbi:amylo-alpha-1,6-glucosidase [Azospirillum argentinense]